MRTTVGYSLNIIVKKNTWEQVPGNPIHWVIYRIHTGPSQLPIYGITVKGLHPGFTSKVGLIVY